MNRWFIRPLLIGIVLLAFAHHAPAPLIYTPGEGWTYEPVGGAGKWQRTRAKEQLEVAQAAFDAQDYGLALKAARRTVKTWPLSDYAPQAQYLVGRCYEANGDEERAFKEYQKVLDKYPKTASYDDVLRRQFEIANQYLEGKWFRLWGYLPLFPSMERTADMYEKVVRNGPYSEIAPRAQIRLGMARGKQANYPAAVKAFERAADRYNDRPLVESTALYNAGLAYNKQAHTAEYDQSTAGKAIAAMGDFKDRYPNDARVPEAEKIITSLRREQARGNFEIAKFYEKHKRWNGALVYYNEVLLRDPGSPYAAEARERIDTLKNRIQQTASK